MKPPLGLVVADAETGQSGGGNYSSLVAKGDRSCIQRGGSVAATPLLVSKPSARENQKVAIPSAPSAERSSQPLLC